MRKAKMVETRQVPLSNELIRIVDERLNMLGIKFPEYIRMLILQESRSVNIPTRMATAAEERAMAKGMRDYQNGNYTTLKTHKEINEHFNKLMGEALNE